MKQAYQDFTATLIDILQFAAFTFTAEDTPRTLHDAILKGDEEYGELSEAVQIYTGRMPHKTLSEPVYGEIADNINQHCDLLAALHGNHVAGLRRDDCPDEEIVPALLLDVFKRDSVTFKGLVGRPDDVFVYDTDADCYTARLSHPCALHYVLAEHLHCIKGLRMTMLYHNETAPEILSRLLMMNALLYCNEHGIPYDSLNEEVMARALTQLHEHYLLKKFAKWQRVDAGR